MGDRLFHSATQLLSHRVLLIHQLNVSVHKLLNSTHLVDTNALSTAVIPAKSIIATSCKFEMCSDIRIRVRVRKREDGPEKREQEVDRTRTSPSKGTALARPLARSSPDPGNKRRPSTIPRAPAGGSGVDDGDEAGVLDLELRAGVRAFELQRGTDDSFTCSCM
jgi:hypothetical protein